MLRTLETPDNVIGFEAVGRVDAHDYETVLVPAVEALIAKTGEVRFVYVLGDEFVAYTAGAGWQDAKLGMGHASKWRRVAVVTNHDWVHHMVGMFAWMVPGDAKAFPIEEQEAAIAWAAG